MCAVVERALCGGRHGGLRCLWKIIDIEFLRISLEPDFKVFQRKLINIGFLMFRHLSEKR
jgi:hypothetical protein